MWRGFTWKLSRRGLGNSNNPSQGTHRGRASYEAPWGNCRIRLGTTDSHRHCTGYQRPPLRGVEREKEEPCCEGQNLPSFAVEKAAAHNYISMAAKQYQQPLYPQEAAWLLAEKVWRLYVAAFLDANEGGSVELVQVFSGIYRERSRNRRDRGLC